MYINPCEYTRQSPDCPLVILLTGRISLPLPLIALPCTALPQPIIDIYQVLIVILVGYFFTALSNLILWFRLQTLCPCQE